MTNFNMSRLWLGRDGNYRDVNGNVIAKKGLALNMSAWKYLAGKYGKDYANRTSIQTKNGNIFLNGKWRLNDILSDKEGRTATWDEASSRIDLNTQAANVGKSTNRSFLNKKQWGPSKSQEGPTSIGGKLVKLFGDSTGLYHIGSNTSDIAGIATYFVPGIGNAMSAGDAFNAARRGDWGGAAMNTFFALPFIGNVGKGIKAGLLTLKFAKAANRVDKGIKVLNKVKKPANYAMNVAMAYDVPVIGSSLYNSYQSVKEGKQKYKPVFNLIELAKLLGATEEDIKNALGDSYNTVKNLSSRDDSFMGNLGTMWDIISK